MSWLAQFLLQLALSRSNAALVRASGGAPRHVRGYTLDPRFQYLENRARRRPIDWAAITPAEARAHVEAENALFGGRREPGVSVERKFITGRSHSVPVWIYLPHVRDNSAAMLVYFHSGGGVVGAPASCDRFCSLLAKIAGAPVLSVDYRLAPEHKFPNGLDDARTAYRWAVANAAHYGAAVGRVGVGGDDLGANFAAIIAQEMRREHGPAPVMQLLIYPLLDYTSETASLNDFADAAPLTDEALGFFQSHYLPAEIDPADVRVSPGREQNLASLAPALIYLAGFDVLLDQGAAYAERLRDAGVSVSTHVFEQLPHGFVSMPAAAPAAEIACRDIAAAVASALKSKP